MKRVYKLIAALTAALVFLALFAPVSQAEAGIDTQAQAIALIDLDSGKLLEGENCDLKLPMASTTKIMTALITLENCDTDEVITVPDEAVGVEGSSIYLEKSERIGVIDLLYGLMLASGNDAAVALAIHVSGSVGAFVDLMNERAESLGLENTHFITPNGLHDAKHLTTAYELCLISREALKNETFSKIVSTKYYKAQSGIKPRTFKNKNSLLWDYEGAFGVKTGYTMAAGRCLVFGAERNGVRVVGAVLNCRPMFETAAKLMDHAFENYVKVTAVEENAVILKTFVQNSGGSILEVQAKDCIMILMQKSSHSSLRLAPALSDDLSAPLSKGDSVGMLYLYDTDELVGSCELIAANDVPFAGFVYWWELLIGGFVSD